MKATIKNVTRNAALNGYPMSDEGIDNLNDALTNFIMRNIHIAHELGLAGGGPCQSQDEIAEGLSRYLAKYGHCFK